MQGTVPSGTEMQQHWGWTMVPMKNQVHSYTGDNNKPRKWHFCLQRWTVCIYSSIYSCTQDSVKIKKYVEYAEKKHNRGTFARNMKWPTKYRKHLMQQNLYWKVLNHEHLHNSHQPEACCWQAFLIFLSEFFGGYIPSQVCIRGSPACYNTYLCSRVKQWAEHLLLPHSHLIPALGFISHYPRAPAWLTLPWMHWYLHPTWHFTGPQTPLLLSTLALGSDTTEPWSGQETWHTGGSTAQDANTKALRIASAMSFSKAEAAV